MMFAVGIMSFHMSRLWFANPDVYGRRQEYKKPLPDRHRQWGYALPFYNTRLRSIMRANSWCMIDNEPEFCSNHPLGYRPNRVFLHRRPWVTIFTIPRYQIMDPLYTSCSYENFNRIYEECGYAK